MSDRQKAEIAAKISNDIAEDIDRGETRAELRSALKWWAMEACRLTMELSSAKNECLMLKARAELDRLKR